MNPKEFKKIAVIGASENEQKYGNKIVRDLRSKGFEVFPVNPKGVTVDGIKSFTTIEQLPRDTELLVFVIPPERGLEELQKAVSFGFRRFWFQPGAGSKEIESFLKSTDSEYSIGKCIMIETSF
ncbi:CoA-binding protein [Pseudothermotoga sp. U03pept]|uniref:CoA-binding protein n=1 Tax=Pseudothermotoga sp. U03pept TaxID=3447012 RepID=UPI003F03590F